MFEFIPKGFYFDFVAWRRFFATASGIAVVLSIVAFFVIGPKWSIDFTGGTELEFHFSEPTSIEFVRETLAPLGVDDESIQRLGSDSRYLIRQQGASSARKEDVDAVRAALEKTFGAGWISEFNVDDEVGTRAAVVYSGPQLSVPDVQAALAGIEGVSAQGSPEENTVYIRLPGLAEEVHKAFDAKTGGRGWEIDRSDAIGPKVGGSLREAGLLSVVISMALLLVYIGIRFDFTFAPGAIICLFHDVMITIGFFVVTRQEFGLSMVSAILTLIGYSLNDTVVVYDRIRENLNRYRRKNFGDLINDSINETLARTIMTSGATALALVPFLFVGGPVLQQFAKVLLFGMVIGSYSTIAIAAPITMTLREYGGPIRRALGLERPATDGAAVRKPKPWEKPRPTEKAQEP